MIWNVVEMLFRAKSIYLSLIECVGRYTYIHLWSWCRIIFYFCLHLKVEEFTAAVKGYEENNFDKENKNKYYKMGKIILEILTPNG